MLVRNYCSNHPKKFWQNVEVKRCLLLTVRIMCGSVETPFVTSRWGHNILDVTGSYPDARLMFQLAPFLLNTALLKWMCHLMFMPQGTDFHVIQIINLSITEPSQGNLLPHHYFVVTTFKLYIITPWLKILSSKITYSFYRIYFICNRNTQQEYGTRNRSKI